MAVAGRGRGQYGLLMLDEASLTEVALFLSARDLLQLALVCRRFGRRRDAVPTTSAEHGGSLAYEAARLQLLRRSPARRATLMPLLTGTAKCVGWLARLRTLENLEAPLEFTRVGPRVRIEEDGVLVTRSGGDMSQWSSSRDRRPSQHAGWLPLRSVYADERSYVAGWLLSRQL